MTHRRSGLIQPIVWRVPIEDSHLQEIVQDVIGHHLLIQHQKILMCPDHIGPEDIVVVKIKEMVLSPPLLNHELVVSLFSWKSNSIGASVEDLKRNQNLVNNNRILILRPPEH